MFASTSIDQNVAEQFSNKSTSSDRISTMLIFHFPQPCDTAINLSAIAEYQLPCISMYEDEKEVLLAPRTSFKVTKIEADKCRNRYTIYLENLCGEQMSLFKGIKFFLTEERKKPKNRSKRK